MRKPRQGKARRRDQVGWSKVLTPNEQRRLWVYLRGERPSALTGKFIKADSVDTRRTIMICELLFSTGLRARELGGLRVQDTPQVLGMNVIEVYRGKDDKDRTIPISADLADKLKCYIATVRRRTVPRHIRRDDYSQPVFYNNQRRPYLQHFTRTRSTTGTVHTYQRGSTAFYKMVRKVGWHAGLAKALHPHMSRHTFAVNALGAEVNIYVLQQLMGHSDITMTARYLHLVKDQLQDLGERLSAARFDPESADPETNYQVLLPGSDRK